MKTNWDYYVFNQNYGGGVNNLYVCKDMQGVTATSLVSKEQSIKNYKRLKNKWLDKQAKALVNKKIIQISSNVSTGENIIYVVNKE